MLLNGSSVNGSPKVPGRRISQSYARSLTLAVKHDSSRCWCFLEPGRGLREIETSLSVGNKSLDDLSLRHRVPGRHVIERFRIPLYSCSRSSNDTPLARTWRRYSSTLENESGPRFMQQRANQLTNLHTLLHPSESMVAYLHQAMKRPMYIRDCNQ